MVEIYHKRLLIYFTCENPQYFLIVTCLHWKKPLVIFFNYILCERIQICVTSFMNLPWSSSKDLSVLEYPYDEPCPYPSSLFFAPENANASQIKPASITAATTSVTYVITRDMLETLNVRPDHSGSKSRSSNSKFSRSWDHLLLIWCYGVSKNHFTVFWYSVF